MSLAIKSALAKESVSIGQQAIPIRFCGQHMQLDARGALYWPEQKLVVVSDLHLEKASFLCRYGAPLPALDSTDTLVRLGHLIHHYRPERVVCLGDSFHDINAMQRLADKEKDAIRLLCQQVDDWIWIAGNHDPHGAGELPGVSQNQLILSGIAFRHEPEAGVQPQIIGHFHPKARLHVARRNISGKCFLANERLLVMPAFGTFTGGLECESPVLRKLMGDRCRRYLIHKQTIWPL